MKKMLFVLLLLAAAVQAAAQDQGVLTKEQLDAIVKKSTERAEAECLNRYTAQAALAGGIAGNLLTRSGTLFAPTPLILLTGAGWLIYQVHEAVVAGKIRAECAAAGAAAGLAVSYWYFQRLYKTPAPAPAPTPAPAPAPALPIPDLG